MNEKEFDLDEWMKLCEQMTAMWEQWLEMFRPAWEALKKALLEWWTEVKRYTLYWRLRRWHIPHSLALFMMKHCPRFLLPIPNEGDFG